MKIPNNAQINKVIYLLDYILPNYFIYKDVLNREYYEGLNEEQITHFKDLKAYYFRLLLGLDIILEGKPLAKTFKELIDEELSEFSIDYLESWLDFYLLLTLGWDEVQSIFTRVNLVLTESGTRLELNNQPSEKSISSSIKTPAQAFVFILRANAIYSFFQCLAFDSRLYTQTLYRDYKTFQKIKQKRITLEPLNAQEEKTLKRAKKRLKNNELKELAIGEQLKDYCLQTWSKSNDNIIKRKLKQYLIITEELNNEVIKPLHPRKNPQPLGWLNGKKVG